jgi:hypothetical protein
MKIKFAIISIISAAFLCYSCSAELAKGSETEIETFQFLEYPEQQISLSFEGITTQMPVEIEDLRMTPIFTVSRGATASPASGEKQDFGKTVKIGVTSEDNLYFSLYEVNVNYPHSTVDFTTLSIADGQYEYGKEFNLGYMKLSSTASDGLVKFKGVGKSNTAAGTVPSDKTLSQFYPNAAQKGKSMMVSTTYDINSATMIEFTRPVNIDTITFTPSVMMATAMTEGLTAAEYGVDVKALNADDKDVLKVHFAGYDKNGKLVAEKEYILADFSYAANTFARTEKQHYNLLTSLIREIKYLKVYLSGTRTDIPAVFFIDAMGYKVLPQPTE